MLEKRAHPRRKMRLIVDFDAVGSKTSGITYDVSRTGLFVRTVRIPSVGTQLSLVLHLATGRELQVSGKVVRTYSAHGTLRFVIPSGFGLRISPKSSDYDDFVSSVFGSPVAADQD
ncbi:MAG: PilZ domain-containing protein [Thermoanaerobaculia bacterium]